MQAVAAGHVEMVSLLLEEGADVAYTNPVSVFFVSLFYVYKKFIIVVNFVQADGNTALHLASLAGSAEIVRLLARGDKKGIYTVNKVSIAYFETLGMFYILNMKLRFVFFFFFFFFF